MGNVRRHLQELRWLPRRRQKPLAKLNPQRLRPKTHLIVIYLEKRKTTTPETVSFANFMFSDETELEKDLFRISYTERRLSPQQIKTQAKVFAWVLNLSMNLYKFEISM